jgi:7-carboxy-7-deazaguanine synthase
MTEKLKVCEIFASIQGESSLQGFPCVFIRLSGCNLNCSYCDTEYAKKEGRVLSQKEIYETVADFGIPYVCITGGEPMLQNGTAELSKLFLEKDFRVSVETNGTFDASILPEGTIRIIDIKCPGSKESEKTDSRNLDLTLRRETDEFKFVIESKEDFDYAVDFVKKHDLLKTGTVLISPVAGKINYENVAGLLVKELPEARLNIQIHRIIWPDIKRGK